MARLPLALPPGVFRNGTEAQSAGRYYDAYLVRWYGKALGPTGGWRKRGSGQVTGKARAILTWKDNAGLTWIAIGTNSKLYVSNRLGDLFDITPSGFTAGPADAASAGGFGKGLFGAGTFGTPRLDSSLTIDATQQSLDHFGENLVSISPDDGTLYKWELNTGTPAAAISGAPTGTALVVTADGFIMVLGTTDPRTLSWCDRRNDTIWTPDATNEAGDFTLQTAGRLMCGCNIQGGTMILTDLDAWMATNIGGTLVFGFDKKGDGCGAISRQCLVPFEMQAAWMSPSGTFWRYNGYVSPIDCDVQDYIRQDINLGQASKIFGVHNAKDFEITWYYCSAASSEIDRAVVWNYRGDPLNGVPPYWNIGRVPRLCGADRGAFQNPVMVDADGYIYDHETGFSYDGAMPYAEPGAISLGSADRTYDVLGLYPDDLTVGDVGVSFQVKNNRDDPYSSFGPYAVTSKTDLRFNGRQVKPRWTGQTLSDWRVGTPSLEITPSSVR